MDNNTASKDIINDFYEVPLMGEVKSENRFGNNGNYSIGELVSNFLSKKSYSLTLKAVDNGLISDGIYPDDYVTIVHNQTIKNGDISAVILGNRIYIRKLFREKKRFRLESSNPAVPQLIIEKNTPDFKIIGKVSTVIREL
jgi:SOS-response transcriptional repressor LexA